MAKKENKAMKIKRLTAALLSLAMLGGAAALPVLADGVEQQKNETYDTKDGVSYVSEASETMLIMTEGDVTKGFAPAGTACESSDPSIAWVDEDGDLNAMKEGIVTVSVPDGEGKTEYTVTVEDYQDGSEIVGNLKLVARYNDSMQFYDGHTYLVFTSYQDGVNVGVGDLYGAYEISDQYYSDIRDNIANGSNHTGKDTDKYFTFSNEIKSMTLDRGEVVSIGMYRGFDLSIYQAALGSLKNSTLWTELSAAGKTAVVDILFNYLNTGTLSAGGFYEKILEVCASEGLDYHDLLNGVVDGGVCFNRELYNQKLEYDQYENVTYDIDITRNQLNMMMMYLNGNLNNFSILKNSCATVALRGWNAAVGTRNGIETSYKLDAVGEGIFSLIDAPKTVRDNVKKRLPGYCLNNAEGVAEPDAGYQDETGWVYVTAPKPVGPINYTYEDETVTVDESRTNMSALIKAANADGKNISYAKDDQEIKVDIKTEAQDDQFKITGIDFDVNGETLSLTAAPEGGIWFKVKSEVQEGESCYAADADGKALPSIYSDGCVSFLADKLPVSYKVVTSSGDALNMIKTTVKIPDGADASPEIYFMNGTEKVSIADGAELAAGTKIFIKPGLAEGEAVYSLRYIKLNGESAVKDHDAEEDAYFVLMPARYSEIEVSYAKVTISPKGHDTIQCYVGDELNAADYAVTSPDGIGLKWMIISGDSVVEKDAETGALKAVGEGSAAVCVRDANNVNIFLPFAVEVNEKSADMAKVTYNGSEDYLIAVKGEDGSETTVPYSGYLVKKGSSISVVPNQSESKAISSVTVNKVPILPGMSIDIAKDTEINVSFKEAAVEGMPEKISLAAKGDTYQLGAKVSYTGLSKLLPVYDKSIRYASSDPIVEVNENGLVTVTGDVPESGKLVAVTAYAGSSNDKVLARTKVIVGDYAGAKPVGTLTIAARRLKVSLAPHATVVFNPYEDTDLNVSFYDYYKPNEKMIKLLEEHRDHPERFDSDPVLYNDNELGIEDRETYFDIIHRGVKSDPQTVRLRANESLSMSSYMTESNYFKEMVNILSNSTFAKDPDGAKLIAQLEKILNGEKPDGVETFDSVVASLVKIYKITKATGMNPVDASSDGGINLNEEMFYQFSTEANMIPDYYYTVEITADELAMLEAYVSDPDNNYYSVFYNNCASTVVDIWNAALSDRPEYQLKGNLTGIAAEPVSLYLEIAQLISKQGLEGKGGRDFYPRPMVYSGHPDFSATISTVGEDAKVTALVANSTDADANASVIASAYDSEGRLLSASVTDTRLIKGTNTLYIELNAEKSDISSVKLITVNNTSEMKPLTDETVFDPAA